MILILRQLKSYPLAWTLLGGDSKSSPKRVQAKGLELNWRKISIMWYVFVGIFRVLLIDLKDPRMTKNWPQK